MGFFNKKIICYYSKEKGSCSYCRHSLRNAPTKLRKNKPFFLCKVGRLVSGDGQCFHKVFDKKDRDIAVGYMYEKFNGKNSTWKIGGKKKFEIVGAKDED